MAGLSQPKTEIRATSSISQRLSEAFKRNTALNRLEKLLTDPRSGVPDYLQEFDDVFSKESFETLPESKPWDHAIELVPGEKATGGFKVYPLSPSEQKELDAFIQENLESGCIRPSKLPMASPVFFIKKKCGGL
jgi:hypothetical protein